MLRPRESGAEETALKRLFTTALVSLFAIVLPACSHTGQSSIPEARGSRYIVPQGVYGGIGPSAASMQVLLGDASPNLYGHTLEKLNLGLEEVDAIQNGQTTVLSKFDKPLVVNVLQFNDDNGQLVANAHVARTQYDQLRLVVSLAASDGVFKGGTTMPLNFLTNTPTFSTVGAGSTTTTTPDGNGAVDIVISQPFSIPQDEHNAVRVDFNAFESLDLWTQGGLVSVPAMFVAPVDESGSINGRVVDSSNSRTGISNAVVVAYAADGSIGNTGSTDSRGNFELQTLPEGTYTLQVYNNYTNATGRTFQSSSSSSQNVIAGPSVTVTGGQEAKAGNIQD